MPVTYCGGCGRPAADGDSYCTGCGRQLQVAAAPDARINRAAEGEDAIALRHAVALLARGDHRTATVALERLCRERPEWAVARAYLGIAYLRTTRVADARAELEEAVRLAPESFICRTKYGEFLARLGFYDQGLAQLDAALKLPPPDSESRLAAMELRQFCKDKAKGLFYRQTAYPKLRLGRLFAIKPVFRRQPVTNGEG
jgi:Tfp pilus assembly protein PilF